MRLLKCYIENFGMLSQYSCEFSSGLNCISSKNSTGKTTLSVFIRAMLYGLSDSRKSDLDENDRKKYYPWQGGAFGGSLSLEVGDKRYTIERSFGERPSADRFCLRNFDTGAVCHDYTERFGEEVLGIDRDGFSKTVFLSECDSRDRRGYASVASVLGSSDADRGPLGEYERALRILEQRRKFYHKRGGGGEISQTRVRLDTLERELDRLERLRESLPEGAGELSRIRQSVTRLEEERSRLTEELGRAGGASAKALERARLEELKAAEQRERAALQKTEDFFRGHIPTSVEIDRARDDYNEARRLERESAAQASPKKLKKRGGALCKRLASTAYIALGVLLGAVGAYLGATADTLWYLVSALGALSAIYGAIRLALTDKGAKRGKWCDGKAVESEEMKRRRDELERRVGEFVSRCAITGADPFAEIRARLGEYEYQRAILNRTEVERRALEARLNSADGPGISERERIIEKIRGLEVRLGELRRELTLKEQAHRTAERECESYDEVLSQSVAEREALMEYTRNLAVIQKTAELLREASENMTGRYLDRTKERLNYYRELMGARPAELNIDAELTLTKNERGGTRVKESYSRGTRELEELALQLALCDSLYGGADMPPLILDDPFISLDDEKCQKGRNMLAKMARDRQILYFTCSESRAF